MPIMYVLCEIDYDDSWYDFIAASPDLGLLQDICLALFQEQDYESYLNDVFYYGFSNEDGIYHISPADCNYFIKEVPLVGCEIVSKVENAI